MVLHGQVRHFMLESGKHDAFYYDFPEDMNVYGQNLQP